MADQKELQRKNQELIDTARLHEGCRPSVQIGGSAMDGTEKVGSVHRLHGRGAGSLFHFIVYRGAITCLRYNREIDSKWR